ncbi:3-hydroxyacyl-CoA dehydrogenase family protein [Flammeovirga kamogawensis]|uniref:3-hydroxybutyryl-CoA dehydrogenase n=1 Tax=Flammeovirga kamogawensis TaxID=373891 RepID=A0ABX8GWM6_9BACT|nr:3-hydroxybutyryl-CoA dehydrogenase [Flammeovirga kamogawensis]MBB6461161.1 3-hydroxybutyryl-CoA dehydrogenase [Flammeovirga kamogawensis]QWG07727.1 3-hydroxybutyryl-CoA dehydrogenase [Flammeovirga kamogawensis]TRX69533.1 3-hydroxybutyryl-CoA dehydrogenase [Flammeovirga kamogawensis]
MKNISVIGSGTMGNGIAHVFAQSGFKVSLIDINVSALDRAMATITKNLDRLISKEKISEETKANTINNLTTFTEVEEGIKNADLIVEAATENVDLKLKIFKQLDELAKPEAILASNTSSISITKIGAATKRPEKVIGMHFMNPVPVMKLVEVIKGYLTDDETTNAVIEIAKQIGKVPVPANDYAGFVANRILMPMINEAIISLQNGVAGVEEIDTIMKLGMAHPMGPLQLADFIGLDVCMSIMNVLQEGLGDTKYAPSPLLVNMVQAGILGVKSGEGFYDWEKGNNKSLVVSKRFL